jgi:hypothetical protein
LPDRQNLTQFFDPDRCHVATIILHAGNSGFADALAQKDFGLSVTCVNDTYE